jgi:hypothetical protein
VLALARLRSRAAGPRSLRILQRRQWAFSFRRRIQSNSNLLMSELKSETQLTRFWRSVNRCALKTNHSNRDNPKSSRLFKV